MLDSLVAHNKRRNRGGERACNKVKVSRNGVWGKIARSKGVAQTYPNAETDKVWFIAMAKVFILNVAHKLAGVLSAAACTTYLKQNGKDMAVISLSMNVNSARRAGTPRNSWREKKSGQGHRAGQQENGNLERKKKVKMKRRGRWKGRGQDRTYRRKGGMLALVHVPALKRVCRWQVRVQFMLHVCVCACVCVRCVFRVHFKKTF